MYVSEWAKLKGINKQTVWRWIRDGKMPVPYEKLPTGTILVHDPAYEQQPDMSASYAVCYARVSSPDQKQDLERQGDRLMAFAMAAGFNNPKVVMEVGSDMNGKRKKLNSVLADRNATPIIIEHRERFARMNFELIESSLRAQGREVIVVDDKEVDDDLVRDMTEVLVSFCARLYGKRSARNRAKRAIEVMERG